MWNHGIVGVRCPLFVIICVYFQIAQCCIWSSDNYRNTSVDVNDISNVLISLEPSVIVTTDLQTPEPEISLSTTMETGGFHHWTPHHRTGHRTTPTLETAMTDEPPIKESSIAIIVAVSLAALFIAISGAILINK